MDFSGKVALVTGAARGIGRTTQKRYGQPSEIGEAVAWLCSDAASYVNGAVLPVDGGRLVS